MKLEPVIFFPIFWFGNFGENVQNVSKKIWLNLDDKP